MNRKSPFSGPNLKSALIPGAERAAIAPTPAAECPTHMRLAKAAARLRNIDLVRNHRRDPKFGKAMEDQIVWRELLELELQGKSGDGDA